MDSASRRCAPSRVPASINCPAVASRSRSRASGTSTGAGVWGITCSGPAWAGTGQPTSWDITCSTATLAPVRRATRPASPTAASPGSPPAVQARIRATVSRSPCTSSTGVSDWRAIRSAVDPSRKRVMPCRPRVPTTSRSYSPDAASSRICSAAWPTRTLIRGAGAPASHFLPSCSARSTWGRSSGRSATPSSVAGSGEPRARMEPKRSAA